VVISRFNQYDRAQVPSPTDPRRLRRIFPPYLQVRPLWVLRKDQCGEESQEGHTNEDYTSPIVVVHPTKVWLEKDCTNPLSPLVNVQTDSTGDYSTLKFSQMEGRGFHSFQIGTEVALWTGP
jgi:hypothetical protein